MLVYAHTLESCEQAECDCQPGGEGTCEIQRADDGTLNFSDYETIPVTIDYPAQTALELVIPLE